MVKPNRDAVPQLKSERDMSPLRPDALARWLTEGSHADIYQLNFQGKAYVVKVGKTGTYRPPFLKAFRITLSRQRVTEFFEKFLGPTFRIMPDEASIRAGLSEYRTLEAYFSDAPEFVARRRAFLVSLADRDDAFTQTLEAVVGEGSIECICESLAAHITDNFLPLEQVVIGHAVRRSQNPAGSDAEPHSSMLTYYIIQDAVVGDSIIPLCRIDAADLRRNQRLIDSLITFVVLAKKMFWDTKLLIDTRPDEVIKHPFEWFSQTSNILVDCESGDIRFVDTRWLWDDDTILGSEGFNLVRLLGVRSLNRALRRYVRMKRVTT